MAALPLSPSKVAGNHSAIYEAYYNYVDPNGYGTIGAMEAARFLKRSGLSDVVLSRVWDLSDPGGRGCLDRTGMFVALKLVALAQQGRDINLANLGIDTPPPKMGDIPTIKPVKPPPPTNTPLITSLPPTAVDWTIKPAEREKYENLFESLQPMNGLIAGNKVKGVLMDSKLPLETLGKIWDLADQDKDGSLDRNEFVAAMHLVYKALEKYAIPNTLPPELMPSTKRKNSTPLGQNMLNRGMDGVKPEVPQQPAPLISNIAKPVQPVQPTMNWVVTPEERSKSDALFIKSDIDKDGFVSGQEIKDVFLQSGVPPPVLAHIWALCDIKQCGKLNNEQFALAMWFVARCLNGIEPPATLTPEMVPPTFRTKSADGLVENNNTRYSNPELDMISKDIEELSREKLSLETDIAQREADIKIKSGEIKSLQSELDTLAATFKQLENQKGEAQKRLNDLKAQVEKLRSQAAEQAEVISAQETELSCKKEQLEGLKREEQRLEQLKTDYTKKLDKLTNSLQDTQLTISQAKNMISQLEEQTRQMNDAIVACDSAISTGDLSSVSDSVLRITPDFRDEQYKRLSTSEDTKMQNGFGGSQDDDPFSNISGTNVASSGFQEDPFKSEQNLPNKHTTLLDMSVSDMWKMFDPFKSNTDAFAPSDPFKATFANTTNNDGFSSDPFGSSFASNSNKSDPFNVFGDKNNPCCTTQPESDKDPFGCDPFAVLHAPTRDGAPPGRPSSPSPALPPKKSKQPPPRPAPPRPMQPPNFNKPNQPDPFCATQANDPFSSSSGGFEGFADFDSKFFISFQRCTCTKAVLYPKIPYPSFPKRRSFRYDIRSCCTQDTLPFSNKPQQAPQPSTATTSTNKSNLDFTDDPFRNYRYEDPFNITFDDEAQSAVADAPRPREQQRVDPFGLPPPTTSTAASASTANDFDPFGLQGGRQSVPLPEIPGSTNAVETAGGRKSVPLGKDPVPPEDEQLAWAAKESLKLEEARKLRQKQEEAELELAIKLSKTENK
ncbi:epidermal growth factor receptor substrate 15-like 1 isoform X4 [Onthophagus taurus]|uniref:epidermal growth factor receptor substrate 15-like 1 isoform X4 n=1 Tax=Onthophagus taurus TaxID=166361 RepID=UPI0039BE8A8C